MRVWANKALNPDVLITVGVNDTLELLVDGLPKLITLAEGRYGTSHPHFTSDLPAEVNDKLIAGAVDVTARIGGIHDDRPRTVLVFEHNSNGTVEVTGGSAFDTIIGSIFMTEGATP